MTLQINLTFCLELRDLRNENVNTFIGFYYGQNCCGLLMSYWKVFLLSNANTVKSFHNTDQHDILFFWRNCSKSYFWSQPKRARDGSCLEVHTHFSLQNAKQRQNLKLCSKKYRGKHVIILILLNFMLSWIVTRFF